MSFKLNCQKKLLKAWYNKNPLLFIFQPAACLFTWIAKKRRALLTKKATEIQFPVPIVVVGNIAVGGTGKTPLVMYLVALLRSHGYEPGIVMRGYGRLSNDNYSITVKHDSDVKDVGDEALLLARQTNCTVVVDVKRTRAIETLLADEKIDIVISDDGLQHYAMPRDIEIVVIDGIRRLGNKLCLPAGPLRENQDRLREVDFVVCNGGKPRPTEFLMTLEPFDMINLVDRNSVWKLSELKGSCIRAVSGIGNPERFFNMLRSFGCEVISHVFEDHHFYRPEDFEFPDDLPIVMTAKDAVKCEGFLKDNMWCVDVEAVLDEAFVIKFIEKLKRIEKSGE